MGYTIIEILCIFLPRKVAEYIFCHFLHEMRFLLSGSYSRTAGRQGKIEDMENGGIPTVEQMPKVSVIIPVYNAEKYLRQCLDSVVNQTLREIEIICVDDGSTDGSLAILQEYAASDARIKVLTQKNQYAGVARNNGMAAAQGKYFAFLDADDYYDLNALMVMFQRMEENSLDVVKAFFYNVAQDMKPFSTDYSKSASAKGFLNRILSFKDHPEVLLHIADVPWNGMYRADFIREKRINFNNLRCVNDHSFFIECMILAQRVMLIDTYVAFYRVSQKESLVSKKGQHFYCQISSYKIVEATVKQLPLFQKRMVMQREFSSLLYWYQQMCNKNPDDISSVNELMKEFISTFSADAIGADYFEYSEAGKTYHKLRKSLGIPVSVSKENDTTPSITIVIPVFNTAKYLDKCLESVINQTEKNLEIICVDDASTDNSRDILQGYAQRDKRISLILKKRNEGSLLARREGVMHAKAEHLIFVDSDDYLSEEACEKALALIEHHGVDILQFSAAVVDKQGNIDSTSWRGKALRPKSAELSKTQIMDDFFIQRNHVTSLVGKIFKTTLCQLACSKTPYQKCYIGEDIYQFFFLALYASSYAGVCTEPLYYYQYGAGVSNNCKMALPKFEEFCKMSKLAKLTREFIKSEHYFNRYIQYCDAMADRMMTDCCRIYQERLLAEDKGSAGRILLSYWRDDSVATQVMARELHVSVEDFIKMNCPVPVYTKIGTAYAESNTELSVSVIIPVYNTERFLPECLNSILGQTLQEIQVICVNDGSWDNSLQILEEYASKDSRITIISQENMGQSAARNAALKISTGRYVCMVDSDDMLEKCALEGLYKSADAQSLDILFFEADSIYMNQNLKSVHAGYSTYYKRKNDYGKAVSGADLFTNLVINNEYRVSPCLQLIRRLHLLQHNILFPVGIVHEDNLFTFENLLQADRAAVINKPYYIRRIREDSVMTKAPGFANVYGYLICYAHMLAFVLQHKLDSSTLQCARTVIDGMRQSAQNTYCQLSKTEKEKVSNLNAIEMLWFETVVLKPSKKEIAYSLPENPGEAALIRASASYRIGRFITWIPRKVRGFFRCCREHGWRYTCKRVLVHLHLK